MKKILEKIVIVSLRALGLIFLIMVPVGLVMMFFNGLHALFISAFSFFCSVILYQTAHDIETGSICPSENEE